MPLENYPSNPTTLSEVYFRVGGPHVGKADIALEVNRDAPPRRRRRLRLQPERSVQPHRDGFEVPDAGRAAAPRHDRQPWSGTIDHVVNGVGGPADTTRVGARFTSPIIRRSGPARGRRRRDEAVITLGLPRPPLIEKGLHPAGSESDLAGVVCKLEQPEDLPTRVRSAMLKRLLDVGPHRLLRDEEGVGHLVRVEAGCEEEHDLELSGSKTAQPPFGLGGERPSLGVASQA
jgi:hypothetical protein